MIGRKRERKQRSNANGRFALKHAAKLMELETAQRERFNSTNQGLGWEGGNENLE